MTSASSDGFSLEEIKGVAREVGVDPLFVERAATRLITPAEGWPARIAGGAGGYQLEFTAEREISKAEFVRVVDAIREATGHQGDVSEVLGALEWKTVGQLSQIHITVSPSEGQTRVRVIVDRGPAAALTLFLPGLAGLVSIGIAGAIIEPSSFLGVASLVAVCLSAGLGTARTLWAMGSTRFRRRLSHLMDSLTRVVDQGVKAEGHKTMGPPERLAR